MFHIQKVFFVRLLDSISSIIYNSPNKNLLVYVTKEKNSKIIMKLHLTVHNHSVPSIAQSSDFIGRKGFGVFVLFSFVSFFHSGGLCAEIVLRVLRVIGHISQ